MYDDGAHNDMDANDNIYATQIPGYGSGTLISYYIKVTDDFDISTYFPENYNEQQLQYECGYQMPDIKVNEFMADNSETITDPQGEYEDWIEIYNNSDQSVNIGGMYITDDLSDISSWYKIPDNSPDSTTIEPHSYLLLWADKDENDGVTHLDFKLSSSGESIGIFAYYGTTPIDTLSFGEQTTDISYGRYPDGTDNWQFFTNPTPGESNQQSNTTQTIITPVITDAKNYPNPFNPQTNISFYISQKSPVTLSIYNLKGEKIHTVYNGNLNSGIHSFVWNGKSNNKTVSSGLYFYKIVTENQVVTGNMILLK